jgi:pyridoxine 5-phosphate synthase
MTILGVNIDHVATLREARKEGDPSILSATKEVIEGGADGITIHLREDRRHIQDDDVHLLRKSVSRLNLEMATTQEMIDIACHVKPDFVCLVPEKREELTTEGGLNVIAQSKRLMPAIEQLKKANIEVSIFIDPDKEQISAAHNLGADYIEIHTGKYANVSQEWVESEFNLIEQNAIFAHDLGLKVNAGHGLNYSNVRRIAKIDAILELNIGHSIVCRSLFTGLKQAVKEMKSLL